MGFDFMVYRICEAFQKCILRENFKITLHSKEKEFKSGLNNYLKSIMFLKELRVPYTEWTGSFDPSAKMRHSFTEFKGITSRDSIVYHTDLDEIPDSRSFGRALEELDRGECDAILGFWRDRVEENGKLNKVDISSSSKSLHEQFPLRCHISENFVGGGMTKKTLAYRANLRVDGGQHQVWCSKLGKKELKDNLDMYKMHLEKSKGYSPHEEEFYRGKYEQTCIDHIEDRSKEDLKDYIMSHLPYNTITPRYCKTSVLIDHFKFIDGLRKYLYDRMKTYKQKKLTWWRDSARFLRFIRLHKGICTNYNDSENNSNP